MTADPVLYERVFGLATVIVNTIENEKSPVFENLYRELQNECEKAETLNKQHPFFLETLADFTLDNEKALEIYAAALALSITLDLPDFAASICFSTAERYQELGDLDNAAKLAEQAQAFAEQCDNQEIQTELQSFMDALKSAS